MLPSGEVVAEWHADGHRMRLILDRADMRVDLEFCPHGEGPDGACYSPRVGGCLVRAFVNWYGLDCNVGTAPAAASMEVGWTVVGGNPAYDDPDTMQVWVIPVDDATFSSWIALPEETPDE